MLNLFYRLFPIKTDLKNIFKYFEVNEEGLISSDLFISALIDKNLSIRK
jgi:hypothetical protein